MLRGGSGITGVAPKASHPTTDPVRLALEVVLFGASVVALLGADQTALALIFAALVAAHLGLTFALGQRPAKPVG
jgi:uncharacterized protein DUF2568